MSGESPARPLPEVIVPLFPLPDVWLFPGAFLPLLIFEPRYRRMIEDSLDGPGRIVVGTILPGHESEMAGAPPVHPVAGLGEIGRHDRLEDGRFRVVLVGLARVRLREAPSDLPYRLVGIQPLEEVPPDEALERSLRTHLERAIRRRTDRELKLPAGVPLTHLTDLLLVRMELPHPLLQELYSDSDVARRARKALAEDAQRPV